MKTENLFSHDIKVLNLQTQGVVSLWKCYNKTYKEQRTRAQKKERSKSVPNLSHIAGEGSQKHHTSSVASTVLRYKHESHHICVYFYSQLFKCKLCPLGEFHTTRQVDGNLCLKSCAVFSHTGIHAAQLLYQKCPSLASCRPSNWKAQGKDKQ